MHPLTRWLVDTLPPAADLEEVAVVAPSAAAARALREATVCAGRDLIGAHFVTAPALARLVCERLGVACPADRPDPLEERALLWRCVAGPGPLSRWARRFPSALAAVGSAVREWQVAGRPGAGDDAWRQEFVAVAESAIDRARPFATRARLLELAGRALAGRDARLSLRRVLVVLPEAAPDLDALLVRLGELGVEVARWTPSEVGPHAPRFRSAPDLEGELRDAARGCFGAAARGTAWSELVVAVPRLGPYAPLLRRAFAAESVPFTTAVESPLILEPRGAACAHAARILLGDAPRPAWLGLLQSSLLREPPPPHELREFDHLSREEYLRGRGPHVADFASAMRKRGCTRVAGLLERWLRAADRAATASTEGERIAVLARFVDGALRPPERDTRDEVCNERVFALLDAAERAARIAPDCAELEIQRELEERGMPLLGTSAHGVRVVEWDEALSCPAHSLWLCGLADGLVPGPGPAESVLRALDREAFGLATRSTDREAQRRALRRLLAHPTAAVFVSRPRQGADGRAVGPSMWLDAVRAGAPEDRTPAHPQTRARERVETGSCPRDLALVRLALDRAPIDALAEIAGGRARTVQAQARALEKFEPTTLARDGVVGPDAGAEIARDRTSVSSLSALGYCPLQHLLNDVLRVPCLPPEPDPCELPRDKLGSRIHEVLEDVYREFLERLRATRECTALADEILGRAAERLRARLREAGGALLREFPTLHELLEQRWTAALFRSLRADLERMNQDGSRPRAIEEKIEATLTLPAHHGATVELRLLGRIDRLDELCGGGLRLIDFKTGRNPDRDVDPSRILQGKKPQLAAYALMLEADGREVEQIEVRAVRPPDPGDVETDPIHALGAAHELKGGAFGDAFAESLGALAELRARGSLVPIGDSFSCGFCSFRTACRRLHPPSAARVEACGLTEVERYHLVRKKTKTSPRLSNGGDA